ncbi:MAG: hypothetical protein AAB375_03580 [Patescibacteria group bacterium]
MHRPLRYSAPGGSVSRSIGPPALTGMVLLYFPAASATVSQRAQPVVERKDGWRMSPAQNAIRMTGA